MPSPACMRQSEVTAVDHGIGQVNLLRSVLVLHRKGDRKAGGQKHGTLLRGLDLCYQISAEGELIYLDLTFAVCGQGSASTGGREVNAGTAFPLLSVTTKDTPDIAFPAPSCFLMVRLPSLTVSLL